MLLRIRIPYDRKFVQIRDEAGKAVAGTDWPDVITSLHLRNVFELDQSVVTEKEEELLAVGLVQTSENRIEMSYEVWAGDVRIPQFGDTLEPGERLEWQSW